VGCAWPGAMASVTIFNYRKQTRYLQSHTDIIDALRGNPAES